MQSWLMENQTRSGDLFMEDTYANDSTMIEGQSPIDNSFAVTPQLVNDHFKTQGTFFDPSENITPLPHDIQRTQQKKKEQQNITYSSGFGIYQMKTPVPGSSKVESHYYGS